MSEKRYGETISNRKPAEINAYLMEKIVGLLRKNMSIHENLRNKARLDHVKLVLTDLIKMEKLEIEKIKNATETGEFAEDQLPEDEVVKDYEMLDHLITEDQPVNVDDLRSVLLNALKMYNDLLPMLSVLLAEYKNQKIRNTIGSLNDGILQIKNKIQNLYDELINKDYW
jgi:hypothetical protein